MKKFFFWGGGSWKQKEQGSGIDVARAWLIKMGHVPWPPPPPPPSDMCVRPTSRHHQRKKRREKIK